MIKKLKTLAEKAVKLVGKTTAVCVLAIGVTLSAKAQLVTPRWGYLTGVVNVGGTNTYAPTVTNNASLNGKVGATNQVLDIFRDRGVTLWLPVSPTNAALTTSNIVVALDTTPNGTNWTTSDIVWTLYFTGTNFMANTNLTPQVLGHVKSIRFTSYYNGWSNTVPIGPLMWSFTP
jgi:hypothetical protein